MPNLSNLFAPASIAVIGASEDKARIGGRTLVMARAAGFTGPIYPVNPRRSTIQGLAAFPTLADIPGPVDCAIIAIPANQVAAAVQDCATKGVGAAVIFSAGFAELQGAGQLLQDRIATIARASGMRVLGPNCAGAFNLRSGAYLSFYDPGLHALMPALIPGTTPATTSGRSAGVVSQSGGYGAHVINLATRRSVPVSHWVTTGNECDIEIGEVLAAFAADPSIGVLVGYIEGIRNPDAFLGALRLAQANRKPVVLMKAGRTPEGALAAASHTASLAGFDAAYDAVFQEFGVYRARTTEEVLDIAYAALGGKLPPDRRIAIMSNSGGMAVQIADFARDAGLEMPALPPEAQARILALNPNAAPHNPVDITAQWLSEPGLIPDCMSILLGDCAVPALILFMGSSGANPVVIEGVRGVMQRHHDRLVIMGVTVEPETARAYEAMGCLVFQEPARAMAALAALAGFTETFAATPDEEEAAQPDAGATPPPGAKLNERAAKDVLAAWGISCPTEAVAATPQQAAEAAAQLGFPVCLKILSADIPHKTDVGGVALGLVDAEGVTQAATRMLDRVAILRPNARLGGLLVTPMLGGGVECIVGAHRDPVFGPMIMVGMGGIGAELQNDVVWRRAPVTTAQALHMVRALKLSPLLTGYRGRPALDIAALARAVSAISRLAAATAGHLHTLEVNPILVLPDGAVALDAVIETS